MAIDITVTCTMCGYKHDRGQNVSLDQLRMLLNTSPNDPNCIYLTADQSRVLLNEIDKLERRIEKLEQVPHYLGSKFD